MKIEIKPKILIVDDAPQNIQVAIEILKNDYTISVATNGQKALEIVKDGLNPDLILLDIIMPQMDGFELCEILKSNPLYANIPIVFLTILENEKDMVKGLELGAVDYITKPFEPKVLQARVNTHVKLKIYHDQLIANLKEKDEMLIKQNKLATLGSMFENITHQWKQPLSAISISNANIRFDLEYGEIDKEKLTQILDMMDSTTEYLVQTIDDFRDFLSDDIQKKYFDIKGAVESTLHIMTSKIKKNMIEVVFEVESYELFTYKNDLIQVLINILNNAIDVLETQETNRMIVIQTRLEKKNFYLSICDNGGGISEENLPKIFNRYFTTKEKKKGSGLGLHMSKVIMEEHIGGSIVAFNKKDGACFELGIEING